MTQIGSLQSDKSLNYHAVTHPVVSPNLYFLQTGLSEPRSPLWDCHEIPLPFLLKCFLEDPIEKCFLFSVRYLTGLFTLTFSPPVCSASCVAADIISTVEFNSSGELLATGDKGGRVVVFQREQEVGNANNAVIIMLSFSWKGFDSLKALTLDCLFFR